MMEETLYVTDHAIQRYCERVAEVSANAAICALSNPVIRKAAAFGARYVILSGGQRVVLQNGRVVTVLPKGWSKACALKSRGK